MPNQSMNAIMIIGEIQKHDHEYQTKFKRMPNQIWQIRSFRAQLGRMISDVLHSRV